MNQFKQENFERSGSQLRKKLKSNKIINERLWDMILKIIPLASF